MSKALDLIKILESNSEISIIKNKWDIYSDFLKRNNVKYKWKSGKLGEIIISVSSEDKAKAIKLAKDLKVLL